jgi:hypothetical protein
MIKEVEGIGITFYSRIFNYCKEATDKPKPVTQLSLFDFG